MTMVVNYIILYISRNLALIKWTESYKIVILNLNVSSVYYYFLS